MNYKIRSLSVFKRQVEKLDSRTKKLIHEKIQLIKENPYRYKRIHSRQYSKVFRVRFSIDKSETRLVYVIVDPNIVLVCLLHRKKDYKDLEKYLSNIQKEI